MGTFDCLSEELVLSILSRIELKFLCRCMLVSKRFSSIVYCIRAVPLTLPSITMDSPWILANIGYVKELQCIVCEEIPEFIQSSSLEKLKLCGTLKKFRELKSIYVEFACPMSLRCSSLLKCEVKCSGAMIESLACVYPAYIYDETKHESVRDLDQYVKHPEEYKLFAISCCRVWLMVLYLLIKCNHTLENVTVTYSDRHGKIVLRDQQVVEWRKRLWLSESGFLNTMNPTVVRLGQVRNLHLPKSGYLMQCANFVLMDFVGGLNTASQHHGSMSWEYDLEDKVLAEAIKEISILAKDKNLKSIERLVYSSSSSSSSESTILKWGVVD